MRTALWETSSGALVALLNSGAPINTADLYTLTLANGTVYRWSGGDTAITGNGNTWVLGPGLQRGKIRWVIGIATDDLSVSITDNTNLTINGQSLMAFIRAGGLIGARLQVDKAYWPVGATQATGALFCFEGRIEDVQGGRYSADLTVYSDLILLDTQVPRELWQASCLNTVYDSACGLSVASFTFGASVSTVSNRVTFTHNLSTKPNGYFDQGFITMTSGANSGLTRSVKSFTTTSLSVLKPWDFDVAPGDTFSATAGCDGTQATCTNKFSNVVHFRGQPYIPTADTVL